MYFFFWVKCHFRIKKAQPRGFKSDHAGSGMMIWVEEVKQNCFLASAGMTKNHEMKASV
jgi:hypothetical protein